MRKMCINTLKYTHCCSELEYGFVVSAIGVFQILESDVVARSFDAVM